MLANGVSSIGSLSVGDLDIYSLSVMSGDKLTVSVTDDDGTGFHVPGFEIFDSAGGLVAFASSGTTASIDYSAQSSEAITIVIRNTNLTTGDYNYSIVATGANGIVDTDGDGLSDIDEVANFTNINNPDSDGDTLTDNEEVNALGTNPLNVDTDSDGFGDDVELLAGSDPLDGSITPNTVQVNVPFPQWMFWVMALFLVQAARSQITMIK